MGVPPQGFGDKDVGEGLICILPHMYDSIIQGTWTFTADANQVFLEGIWNNITGAGQNDELEYKIYLDIGIYVFGLLGAKATNGGIITVSIDGVSVGTIDQYNGSSVYDQLLTITGITLSTKGLKTVSLKMATKNGSSSDYIGRYGYLWFRRTA